MSKPIISISNISKKYVLGEYVRGNGRRTVSDLFSRWTRAFGHHGETTPDTILWALKDVSLDVQEGEAVGVIGRNGAGKSTLLKILSRITEPTSGRIILRGRVASLLEIGTGFNPELTGRENIYLNGSILGMRKAEIARKFDEIVAFSEMEKFLDTPVKRYSSGMYVRLAFAVAAHLEPEILIVDEVLAVGDAMFQKKCLGKMGGVAKEGRTVIFVSHQLDMVRALCRRGVLLEHGVARTVGDIGDVMAAYTKSHLSGESALRRVVDQDGTLPIQIVSGHLEDVEGRARNTFDVFEPIVLHLSYIVRRRIVGGIVKIEIKNGYQTLFWSFDTDSEPGRLDARDPGTYHCTVSLPAPLFKSGRYTIAVGTGVANSDAIQDIDDFLAFEVELTSKPSTFLSYGDKRPGILAVPLEWKLEQFEPV